ncbi:hypothetical protein Golax_025648 [Gossypium laxum]|uniref:Uncharacterized protein n=1 Tax=Gossypium laxum TaxID=34288 RepID=A0A7J9B2I0_9ROSI|nr:hypothetical protein [Gossypium laxum]
MLRPYAIKGKKRKNRGEKYDKEEQVEEGEEKEMAKPAAIENPTEEVEALLSILDSPINKARRLQAVYVRTEKGFSYSSDKLVKMRKYVDAVGDDVNLVFVVSAMVHGKLELDYIDDFIAIPSYPLSATMCIARITEALADKWSIL